MTATTFFRKICTNLGENNKPTYVVMAIATVKGICRPMFTMMDKTENPDTKKYTALREGLTEIIAIPAYFACGELASKLADTMVSKNMDAKYKKAKEAGKEVLSEAKQALLKEDTIKNGKKSLMFIGVCTAALFIIPGLCSLAIKPIMDKMGLKAPDKKQNSNKTNLNIIEGPKVTMPVQQTKPELPIQTQPMSFNNKPQIGLKVGGL